MTEGLRGSAPATPDASDEREQSFLRMLYSTADYAASVHAAGDLMWYEAGHPRRAEVVEKLGLSDDITDMELRRALFERSNKRGRA